MIPGEWDWVRETTRVVPLDLDPPLSLRVGTSQTWGPVVRKTSDTDDDNVRDAFDSSPPDSLGGGKTHIIVGTTEDDDVGSDV